MPARALPHHVTRRLLWIGALSLALNPAAARADSLKLGGLWIDVASVDGIENGKLTYTGKSGSETQRDIKDVQGIKLEAYPELAAAVAALEANKPADAMAPLAKVEANATHLWVKHWAAFQFVQAAERANKPIEAVDAFIRLVRDNADTVYVARPPLKVVFAAAPEQRKEIALRVNGAMPTATGIGADSLKKVADQAAGAAANTTGGSTPAASTPGATPGASTPAAPGKSTEPAAANNAGSAMSAPTSDPASASGDNAEDPIAVMLQQGKYEQALAAANEILAKPNNEMARRLYQRGVAQLALAEQKNDQALLKDAGLSFMRVCIYFPKSPWVGQSLLEAGVVHMKINRPDIARKLFKNASGHITEDEDPKAFARLEALIKQVGDARGK